MATEQCPAPRLWMRPAAERLVAFVQSLMVKEQPTERQPGSSWNLTRSVSPVDVYCYLKARFGEPYGFMMMLKSPSVDNFCHWHYTVEADGTFIDILGLDVRTEIRIYERPDIAEAAWLSLEAELQQEFDVHRGAMAKVRATFERWHLFVNPYRRLRTIVDRYVARLRELDPGSFRAPTFPTDPAALPQFIAESEQAKEKWREAMALSTSLELVAPVMGEAAINFLMLLLARPEIRSDARLYEDFTRRAIDVRIKSLHLSCVAFKEPITGSEEEFKAFLRLMNRRNDLLHGNVNPKAPVGDEILFDRGTIPLVPRHRNLPEIALANALANAKPDESLQAVDTVERFVNFLISRLEADAQAVIRRYFDEEQLGYRAQTGGIGLILPNAHTEIVIGSTSGGAVSTKGTSA